MQTIIQPIRLYAKKDSSVVIVLIGALKYIAKDAEVSKDNRVEVQKELVALKIDVMESIDNKYDREKILALFQ